ncbi:MAG: TIGR02453 family protein, partial [Gallionella sp.]
EVGKDIHAPGYYVHIAPDECFVGVGLWHPEADVLFKIREAIVKNGKAWVAARDDKAFSQHFSLEGDALANAPRGFAKDHPLVEDLKRKDFIALADLSDASVTSARLLTQVVEHFRQAAPLMRFLCKALELRF